MILVKVGHDIGKKIIQLSYTTPPRRCAAASNTFFTSPASPREKPSCPPRLCVKHPLRRRNRRAAA
jgi:hypothetical protein